MNTKYKLLVGAFIFGSIFHSVGVNAQISSSNAFLQGSYVEVGIAPCGSFGSSVTPPAGYHARSPYGTLGFVADPAKDGFGVGSPNFVGDYFLPGSPEEGFGLTINGTDYNNNQVCSVQGISGSIINYSSTATEVSATWQGTVSGLSITAKSYIPAGAVYFITQVTVTNTSSTTKNNVYYMRNVDPDHGVYTPGAGGDYTTNNSIAYQNPNTCNRALATATTLQGSNYLGLGSIDSRARVTMGGFSNRSAADVWNGNGLFTSGNRTADEAVSISFNLGNLAPNQTTTFAYAYILSAADLDAALAATIIGYQINGSTYTSGTQVDVCSGVSTPISLTNTSGYSTITWTPTTGLDVFTGPNVNATITSPTTYTVNATGTCGTVQLSIPLNPINSTAIGNAGTISGPGTINLGQTGVTYSIAAVTGATSYIWTLPPGSTVTSATSTSNSITFNASNTPWCGNVTVTPINACATGGTASLPVCLGSSISTGAVSSPSCAGSAVSVSYTFVGTYYAGNVFTAQLSNASGSFASPVAIGSVTSSSPGSIAATIPASTPTGSGYRIRVVSSTPAITGSDNGSNIVINAMPVATISASANICSGTSTPLNFTGTPNATVTYNANGGANQTIVLSNGGTATVNVTPAVNTTYTATSVATASCTNTLSGQSASVSLYPLPTVSIAGTTSPVCNGQSNGSIITSASGGTPGYSYLWTPGNQTTANLTNIPAGTYSVTISDSHGCTGSASTTLTQPAVLTGPVTGTYAVPSCPAYNVYLGYGPQYITLTTTPGGGTSPYTYNWTPVTGISSTHAVSTSVTPAATTTYTQTVTDAHNCVSTATYQVKVLDVHCGPTYVGRERNNTITMCHNGASVCVSPTTAAGYIANNECLGPCGSARPAADNGVSTESNITGLISVFPNPTHTTVNIGLSGIGSYYQAFQIMDLTGKVVAQQIAEEGVAGELITIDVANYAPGVYLIRVVGKDHTAISRFTVD